MVPLYYKGIEPQAQFSSCLLVVLQGEGGRPCSLCTIRDRWRGRLAPWPGGRKTFVFKGQIDLHPSN